MIGFYSIVIFNQYSTEALGICAILTLYYASWVSDSLTWTMMNEHSLRVKEQMPEASMEGTAFSLEVKNILIKDLAGKIVNEYELLA